MRIIHYHFTVSFRTETQNRQQNKKTTRQKTRQGRGKPEVLADKPGARPE